MIEPAQVCCYCRQYRSTTEEKGSVMIEKYRYHGACLVKFYKEIRKRAKEGTGRPNNQEKAVVLWVENGNGN